MTNILSLRPARPIMFALLGLATLASAAATACSKNNEAAGPPSSYAPQMSTAVIGVRGERDAAFLVGPSGLTLYVFAKDSNGVSNCSGECIEDWPALTVPEGFTPDAVNAADGARDVLKRSDNGKFQVTYDGMPLYYFAADKLPGDTKGDGIGGVWSIARP